jgi:arylformamidase
MNKEEVERGYNNRAAVPDHPQHFATYAAWSKAAREKYAPKTNLRYGPNPRELLDLFLPTGTPRGTYLYIHGGYWRALSKEDYSFVAGPFLDEGIAVAVMEYDLCPQVSIATIVDECVRACSGWSAKARSMAPRVRSVVGGSSAGGISRRCCSPRIGRRKDCRDRRSRAGSRFPECTIFAPSVDFSFNGDFKLDEAEAWRMSPLAYRAKTRAPFVIACGTDETTEFLRQTQILWDAWSDVRRPVDGPLFIPGRDHFTVQLDHADAESDLTLATLALF